ncbi:MULTISPECIES: branched-chain amino acid ABC transporter permease [unclassified Streptosporangium]|uniref:branched-chain amino acid ABC transporter permease n=1 Tax=unclassified Streptosporangium TaxID=2632669 RepID=UPI002E2E523F|nr:MULTISPECIES: branched-chain amino acid ABC transporter permease [unclassified Streptosporangium]
MDILMSALRAGFSVDAAYFCLAAIGLNVQFGYAGLINFGQAGFLAVGAYGFAVGSVSLGLPFFAAIGLGLLCSVVLGLVLGLPTLRLRADYLAIATIASSEVLRLFFGAAFQETFHGRDGISGFSSAFQAANPYQHPFLGYRPTDLWVMTVGWGLVVIVSVIVWSIMRAPWGRVLKAIREDEDAVRSLGKSVYAFKMQALAIGGLIGALGGFVVALGQNSVQPDNFSFDLTFIVCTMLILGGAARIMGPVVGAILFWAFLSLVGGILSVLTEGQDPVIPTWLMTGDQIGTVRFIFVGVALVLLMVYRPQGIFGDRKEMALNA